VKFPSPYYEYQEHSLYCFQGFHFGIRQLKEIGSTFCMGLSSLEEETKKRANLPASNRLSSLMAKYGIKIVKIIFVFQIK